MQYALSSQRHGENILRGVDGEDLSPKKIGSKIDHVLYAPPAGAGGAIILIFTEMRRSREWKKMIGG